MEVREEMEGYAKAVIATEITSGEEMFKALVEKFQGDYDFLAENGCNFRMICETVNGTKYDIELQADTRVPFEVALSMMLGTYCIKMHADMGRIRYVKVKNSV